MPADGRPWRRVSGAFKAKCASENLPCWLCKGSKGPINYKAAATEPLSYTTDHIVPTSLNGDPLRHSNLAPAHRVCNISRGNTTRGQFPTSRQW